MDKAAITKEEVLDAWFSTVSDKTWFRADANAETALSASLRSAYDAAAAGHLAEWRNDAQGCLALVILFDALPRILFRGSPQAFATDPAALAVANHAVARGLDIRIPAERRAFLYLPFQHSEELADQQKAVSLFEFQLTDRDALDFAKRRMAVIQSYTRFPHRNPILGRRSTSEELEYMQRTQNETWRGGARSTGMSQQATAH